MTTTEFEVESYSVRRISDLGLWLVTTRCPVDLGLLFLRYQEFYESPNKDFTGKKFQLVDYFKWACTKEPKDHTFNYFQWYEGFNIPGDSLESSIKIRWDDANRYDDTMRQIADAIRSDNKFYLIGSTSKNSSVIDHEIAHGLFYLCDEYQVAARALVNDLGTRKWELMDLLRDEGYGENALIDEAQAYMATGLTEEMAALDKLRIPFMQLFAEHRSKFIVNA